MSKDNRPSTSITHVMRESIVFRLYPVWKYGKYYLAKNSKCYEAQHVKSFSEINPRKIEALRRGDIQSAIGAYGTPSVPKPHVSETCEMFRKHVHVS